MTPGPIMRKPEKRKAASLAVRVEVFLRQGVLCAGGCGNTLPADHYIMDHIQPLDALGGQEPENWQGLCAACNAKKTRVDLARARKGARIRGETGQLKRQREHGPVLRSRNTLAGRRASKPIPSRRFDKTLTRGFDGKVRPRKQTRGTA